MKSKENDIAAFRGLLGEGEGPPPKEIMSALIKFSTYRDLKPECRPQVFDDPYVAALLVDQTNNPLGICRKSAPQQRHAEPNAILDALSRIQTDAARNISDQIEKAYTEKSWLKSSSSVTAFERLFANAANEIRSANGIDKIVLYSTLEPCRDYETQPSCACLICSAGIAQVYYAADDTNPKGQGRVILETGKPPGREAITKSPPKTKANLASDEAIQANALFYTVGSVVQRFFDSFDLGQSTHSNAYSIFSTQLYPLFASPPDEERRVAHRFKNETLPPIYTGALDELGMSATSSNAGIEALDTEDSRKINAILTKGNFDEHTVLVLKRRADNQLLDILCDRVDHSLSLPKTIISTLSFEGLSGEAIERLKSVGVSFYPHSFRKHHERFSAHKHVLLSDFRDEFGEHIFVLLKYNSLSAVDEGNSEPYESMFGTVDQLAGRLSNLARSPSRISVFVRGHKNTHALNLIDKLADADLFDLGNRLSQTSIHIRLCDPPNSVNESALSYSRSQLVRLELTNRVTVLQDELIESLDAETVSRLLSEMSVSPTAFSSKFLRQQAQSVDWRERKNAGAMLSAIISKEPQLLKNLTIAPISKIVSNQLSGVNWTSLCSYLNAIEDLSRTAITTPNVDVETVLNAVAQNLVEVGGSEKPNQWARDVLWRWSACWVKHASSPETLAAPFCQSKLGIVFGGDPFLISQLVFYISVNADRASLEEIFEKLFSLLEVLPEAQTATAVMLARTSFGLSKTVKSYTDNAFELAAQKIGPETFRQYKEELGRCEFVWRDRLGSVESTEDEVEQGKRFATLTNLRATIPAIVKKVPESEGWRPREYGRKSWRGDQTAGVRETLPELSSARIPSAIRGLICDTDVSTQWAGLAYTLGSGSTALDDAIAPKKTKLQLHHLRDVRTSLLGTALKSDAHYWLVRETISHYGRIAKDLSRKFRLEGALDGDWALPSLSTFPAIKDVFYADAKTLHPEVLKEFTEYKKFGKSIALVLPPIEFPDGDEEIEGLQNEGSPPLGIGQIATALSAHGHYVEIFDVHRYPMNLSDLARILNRFDIVGFSVVFSTLAAVDEITKQMVKVRHHQAPSSPVVVLGGHALSLNPEPPKGNIVYDYIVQGAGEEAMLAIAAFNPVDLKDRQFKTCQLNYAAATKSGSINYDKNKSSNSYTEQWSSLPWINRQLFRSIGEGQSYEPAPTRSGKTLEAHIVMTRGCNWHCSFCTEALISGRRSGEMRRGVDDVTSEIEGIMRNSSVSRIQFVDDNVFPSAPDRKVRTEGEQIADLEWAKLFVENLRGIKSQRADFSWRGLMRVEDLKFYTERVGGFIDSLVSSGCNLLAFGIESGVQTLRDKMKGTIGPGPSNAEIAELMRILRSKKIHSKAYFILGGPDQNQSDIENTIAFAEQGEFDLAYFAIYKDFRRMVSATKLDILDFDLYPSFIDDCLSSGDAEKWRRTFKTEFTAEQRRRFSDNYAKLSALGFRFSNMIKYNDYHASGGVYANMGFRDVDEYLQKLAEAYLRFYCREGWADTYAQLLGDGY